MIRICNGCSKPSDEENQLTCCSSHVNLNDFGSYVQGCFDDMFYCPNCLNKEGFCFECDKKISKEIQEKIGKYLDKK